MSNESYTKEILDQQFTIYKLYVVERMKTTTYGVKIRLPNMPEDISENIIKYILHFTGYDTTTKWDCKKGDLYSSTEGIQECKCFTSNGPISFTPSSNWNILYCLDAREWKNNIFVLYRISLQRTSDAWKNIQMNKKQIFEDQCQQGRRPRITWKKLYPQIQDYCTKIYEGSYENIFVSSANKKDTIRSAISTTTETETAFPTK